MKEQNLAQSPLNGIRSGKADPFLAGRSSGSGSGSGGSGLVAACVL